MQRPADLTRARGAATLGVAVASLVGIAGCAADPAVPATSAAPSTSAATAVDPQPTPDLPASAPDDLCLLLRRDEVGVVLGFPVEPVVPLSLDEQPSGENRCVWRHHSAGMKGGWVLVAAVPAERVPERFAQLIAGEPVLVAGEAATLGHSPTAFGAGPNSVLVDLGDVGMSMVVSAYQELDPDQVVWLAGQALQRWRLDEEGEIPLDTTSTTTPGATGGGNGG